jgi:hypothetical protein
MIRRWLDRWWHRHVVGHELGAQVYLCTVPSPFADEDPDHPVICDVFAQTCQDCYWAQISTSKPEIVVSA